jgi:hypothetical protein
MGYYEARDHPTDPAAHLYVFELHTDKGFWKLYKRFSKFHDTYTKLCSYQDETTIRVPTLPSKALLTLSDNDLLKRFKSLFEWLQTVLDHLQANCSAVLLRGAKQHQNALILKQVKIFLTFLCEGANSPTKPATGILPDWATPTNTASDELNELAQKLDLNYDPANIETVPWMRRVSVAPVVVERESDLDPPMEPQGALADLETSVRIDIHAQLQMQAQAARHIQKGWRGSKQPQSEDGGDKRQGTGTGAVGVGGKVGGDGD